MNKFDTKYMNLKILKLKEILNKEKTVKAVANELNLSRQTIHK
jgi:predicted transcriptional regulator